MKNKLMVFIATAKKSIEGYPIVKETAPKFGKRFKVDRNDPNFDRPLSELSRTFSS